MDEKRKVWLYTCLKTSDPGQMEAANQNMELMKQEAQEMGFIIAGISIDSNRRIAPRDRAGMREMMAAIQEGKAHAVMMPSLNSISRQIEEVLPIIDEIKKYGAALYAKEYDVLTCSALHKLHKDVRRGGEER